MAPTEQIFWEARHKPGSLRGSRRASTVIDASGCKVTRGFLLPSRSPSRHSSSSSQDTESQGTLASPLQDACPGFFRPTGSLYHAPEMAILRSDSVTSLHKPSQLGVFNRPPQLGGRSQTFHGRRASCWYDAAQDSAAPARDANPPYHTVGPQKPMRRTQSDHTGLISLQAATLIQIDTRALDVSVESCAISDVPEEENAIASDSEDEDDEDKFPTMCNAYQVSGIAAQRSRPTYAQRRAMSDQRVVRRDYLPPLPCVRPAPQVSALVVATAVQYVSTALEEAIDTPIENETPIEVKSFAREEMIPHHALRPSRSRPQPTKGVLKTAGSRSSSEDSVKQVHTSIRRGSGSVVDGRVVPDPASQME